MICEDCIHNAVCEREHFENHCGYKHTEADIINPELEKIVEYAQEACILRDNVYEHVTEYSVSMSDLRNIIDKRILELKGESDES